DERGREALVEPSGDARRLAEVPRGGRKARRGRVPEDRGAPLRRYGDRALDVPARGGERREGLGPGWQVHRGLRAEGRPLAASDLGAHEREGRGAGFLTFV